MGHIYLGSCGEGLDQPLFGAATRISDAVRRAVRVLPLGSPVAVCPVSPCAYPKKQSHRGGCGIDFGDLVLDHSPRSFPVFVWVHGHKALGTVWSVLGRAHRIAQGATGTPCEGRCIPPSWGTCLSAQKRGHGSSSSSEEEEEQKTTSIAVKKRTSKGSWPCSSYL